MKRAKIMLIAIAVLATVGGALAFKANSKFTLASYCTIAPNGFCTLPAQITPADDEAAFTTFYTTTNSPDGSCSQQLQCRAISTSFTNVEP